MDKLLNIIKNNKEIHQYIKEIKNHLVNSPISDIVDEEGNQYIDLVLEGGGVLGIALVGYTYVLEQSGIRFLNLAGTSVGAINALFLAALGTPEKEKSIIMLEILNTMNIKDFVDGGWLASNLVDDIKDKDNFWVAMLPKILGLGLLGKFGKNSLAINSGDSFEKWVETELNKRGITTTQALQTNLINSNLKIRNRIERSQDQIRFEQDFQQNELAIVTADISTESKIIFPRMAELYWKEPHKVHPKNYVRASMSIPLFFKPYRVDEIPQNNGDSWKKWTGYVGRIPSSVYFVDGGIVSNFPIDIFHQREYIPLCPTFGVKLNTDRNQEHKVDEIKHLLGALFNTARHTADYSFLHQNDDYKKLIAYIDTSLKYPTPKRINLFKKESDTFHWLDFEMSDMKKAALFALGAKAAYDFIIGNKKEREEKKGEKIKEIKGFNWIEYKNIRKKLCVSLTF